MDIHIRKAAAADLTHILHHRRAMFEEMGFRDPAVLDRMEDLSEEYFGEALRAGKYVSWLVEDSHGQIVGGGGVLVASWPGFPGENRAERAWILNMYVEPGMRLQGLAKRLMEAMIRWCRERGLSSVSLHASSAGRPVYESLGFQQTNEMRFKLS